MLSMLTKFLPFSPKALGIMAVVGAVVIGGFYWYFTYSQDKIAELQKELEAQAIQVEILKQDNEILRKNFKQQAQNLSVLDKDLKDIRKKASELSEKLARHDFEELVKAKPGMLEKRINDGTKKVFEDIRGATKDD